MSAAVPGKRVCCESLPAAIKKLKGGIDEWNGAQHPELATLYKMIERMCVATTVEQATHEVRSVLLMGHPLWAYVYMRRLYHVNLDLYYATLLQSPELLLPVVYTPTVGEACQKFGRLPFFPRGCYVSIAHRGNLKAVIQEYAEAHLEKDTNGKPLCDCIVFSDGGRILGLGDLGTWGMGIPIGKLDLYTVCAGVNPRRTIPVIIDAGCQDKDANTDKLIIRDDPMYTGLKQDRVMHKSEAGTMVNTAYYGPDSLIEEFMKGCVELFGKHCLLQFEDFNSNDAFPLLANYRDKFLTYNDDIQGTAAVTVAGLLGAMKLLHPKSNDLQGELRKATFLFHGAGAANIGALSLLMNEAGVPRSQLFVTNSRGLIWKSADGSQGSFRNDEQKEFAQIGEPSFDGKDLATVVGCLRPTCLIGAVGRCPNCFDKRVIEVATAVAGEDSRPVIFALSNPKTQAEVTAADAYTWSKGKAIYGSGTAMEPFTVGDQLRKPGQVNNVYIFPGMSMGAVCCKATTLPERLFLVAGNAVAETLNEEDLKSDRVVPHPSRIREVGLNVAVAVAMECQKLGIAEKNLGSSRQEVEAAIREAMWVPSGYGDVGGDVGHHSDDEFLGASEMIRQVSGEA